MTSSNFLHIFIIFILTVKNVSNALKLPSLNEPAVESVTFKSSRFVTPEKIKPPLQYDLLNHHLIDHERLYLNYYLGNASIPVQATNFMSRLNQDIKYLIPTKGFTETVFHAYKNHHNLVIRPDDVWIAILVQFSYYVNAHAEQLRTKFVNFTDKKELHVVYFAPLDLVPIDEFINKTVDKIRENVNENVVDWIMPNFTTTTPDDVVTAGAVMMSTLQSYFKYNLALISCGIPEITLKGSLEDWREIRAKVGHLEKYELPGSMKIKEWVILLQDVIDNFIQIKETGRVDYRFWESIARHYSQGGCGGPGETYLNGWITVFSVFNVKGEWQVETDRDKTQNFISQRHLSDNCDKEDMYFNYQDISVTRKPRFANRWPTLEVDKLTPGVVSAPIVITDQYAGDLPDRTYHATLFAGHVGYGVRLDGVTMEPLVGWMFKVVGTAPRYLKEWHSSKPHWVEGRMGGE